MKLLVISDSHGRVSFLEAILRREADCAYLIHLGDGAADMTHLMEYTAHKKVFLTRGNCDAAGTGLKEQHVFTAEGVRALACHGHRFRVKYGLQALYYAGLQENAELCLFGHTHMPTLLQEGEMLLLNPGAAYNGRYAVVTVENGRIAPELKQLPE